MKRIIALCLLACSVQASQNFVLVDGKILSIGGKAVVKAPVFVEDITTGLVHWYNSPTNASGKVPDSSGNGNTGELVLSAYYHTNGTYEVFGGPTEYPSPANNGYILSDNNDLNADEYTICMNVFRSDGRFDHSLYGSSTVQLGYLYPNSGGDRFEARANNGAWVIYDGEEDFYNWTHLIVKYNTSDDVLHIYINGQEVTNGVTGNSTGLDGNISYGKASSWAIDGMPGYFGPVRLYDRELTDAECLEVYTTDGIEPINKAILFTEWGTNTVDLIDESGNGHDFEVLPSVASGPERLTIGTNVYMEFDGSDDRAVAHRRIVPKGRKVNKWTRSFWLRQDDIANQGILSNMDGAGLHNVYYAGKYYCYLGNAQGTITPSFTDVGGWRYHVSTYDGTEAIATNRMKYYIDNERQAVTYNGTVPETFGGAYSKLDLYIGWAGIGYFDGGIDRLSSTGAVWSVEDIEAEYLATAAQFPFYEVSRFEFNEYTNAAGKFEDSSVVGTNYASITSGFAATNWIAATNGISAHLELYGSSLASYDNDYMFNPTNSANAADYTLAAWVKYDDNPLDAFVWYFGNTATKLALVTRPDGSFDSYRGFGVEDTPVSVITTNWTHIAVSYSLILNDRVYRLFIDGVEVASASTGSTSVDGFDGKLFGAAGSNYRGKIDDVRIFTNGLYNCQVFKLYEDTKGDYGI